MEAGGPHSLYALNQWEVYIHDSNVNENGGEENHAQCGLDLACFPVDSSESHLTTHGKRGSEPPPSSFGRIGPTPQLAPSRQSAV